MPQEEFNHFIISFYPKCLRTDLGKHRFRGAHKRASSLPIIAGLGITHPTIIPDTI